MSARGCIIFLLVVNSSSLFANEDESSYFANLSIGYMLYGSALSRDDVHLSAISPYNLFFRYDLEKHAKVATNIHYRQFVQKATQEIDHADIDVIAYELEYSNRIALTRAIKFRWSAGVGVEQLSITNIYSIDQDGFLLKEKKDIKESTLAASLNLHKYFSINKNAFIKAESKITANTNKDININVGVGITWSFK